MADSSSTDDIPLQDLDTSKVKKEKKILEKQMKRWIDENLDLIYFHSDFSEMLIKKLIRKFGEDNDYAKLIQSELKKVRPTHRPLKNTDRKKLRIRAEYQMLRDYKKGWSRYECLEYLAIQHGYTGENSWRKIEKLISDANKIAPNK